MFLGASRWPPQIVIRYASSGGPDMTLQSKIERYIREVSADFPQKPVFISPLARMLWRLNFDVPPPALWPFWVQVVISGGVWAILQFAFDRVMHRADSPSAGPIEFWFNILGGLVFGVLCSCPNLGSNRRRISPWYSKPADDA